MVLCGTMENEELNCVRWGQHYANALEVRVVLPNQCIDVRMVVLCFASGQEKQGADRGYDFNQIGSGPGVKWHKSRDEKCNRTQTIAIKQF